MGFRGSHNGAGNLNTSGMGLVRDDPDKKIRKPYTITKSRESWSEVEHDKFLEALQLFDRDWKKIEAFVGSKTVIQIRSHAQKYFLKVQKSGTSAHVPSPRPKRKAAHPYPRKAPKNVVSQDPGPYQPPAALPESGFLVRPDSLSVSGDSVNNAALSPWTYNTVPGFSLSYMTKGHPGLTAGTVTQNLSSSNGSIPRFCTTKETNVQGKEQNKKQRRVMPDFAHVYSFIGSVFDPSTSDHVLRLKMMDPINVETALMLMKNLLFNLTSPAFEDHRRLLSGC